MYNLVKVLFAFSVVFWTLEGLYVELNVAFFSEQLLTGKRCHSAKDNGT